MISVSAMAGNEKPGLHGPGDGPISSDQSGGRVALTYAQRAGGGVGKRKKLNVLDVILERKDINVNFNLTKEELSKLLF